MHFETVREGRFDGVGLNSNYRPVSALHRSRPEEFRKSSRRLGGSGKEDHPGSRPVNSVNNEERTAGPLLDHVNKRRIAGFVALGWNSCRF